MATRRSTSSINSAIDLLTSSSCDPLRELFEACRNGEVSKVKKLVNPQNVNARDTAGRKSSPLHFAAGIILYSSFISQISQIFFILQQLCVPLQFPCYYLYS